MIVARLFMNNKYLIAMDKKYFMFCWEVGAKDWLHYNWFFVFIETNIRFNFRWLMFRELAETQYFMLS